MNDTIKAIEVSFYDKENSLQLATDIYTAHVKPLGNSMAVPVMRWIGERIHNEEGALSLKQHEETS